MGYTHYWAQKRELPRELFNSAVADCRKVCDGLGIPLGDAGGKGRPVFSQRQIRFNGDAESGVAYETFAVDRVFRPRYEGHIPEKGWWHSFCKTQYRPYDLAVQCCLIVLSHNLGSGQFKVSSDGSTEQWNNAREACQRILGYGADWGEGKLALV